MSSLRTLGWRAAEAAVLAGFAFVVGLGPAIAVIVGLVVLGVGLAEATGARYDAVIAARHAALALACGVFVAVALARGARWIVLVLAPPAGWFVLDAIAQRAGAREAAGGVNGTNARNPPDESPGTVDVDADAFADADLAGELLRELRAGPCRPADIAVALDVDTARVRRALAVLDARGTVERDAAGRYHLPNDAFDPFALPMWLYNRVVAPLRRLR